jgi:glycosyltransferase involved in cell wall biosynthesis
VVDGETGLVVPVDDADALAQALVCLIDDPTQRRRLGERARQRAERDFEPARIWAGLLNVYIGHPRVEAGPDRGRRPTSS